MPFSPSPAGSPTAGAPPPPPPLPLPLAAPPVVSTSPWEPHPAKEAGPVVAPAAAAAALEAMPRLPSEDNHSETENLEHEKKVNKYQSVLAARLKAKYFSSKAFEKGDVFEEIVIQSETIRSSRWPFTRSFADPAKFCEEKSYIEHIYPSVAGEDMSRNMHII
ncbi:hypothetical protein ACP4OV_017868 [Aristida adscensionis]